MTDACLGAPRRSATPASSCCASTSTSTRHRLGDEQLAERIGDYDGILIRSATQVDAELIARGDAACKAIGRAGVGVDNVDVAGRDQARHRRRQRAAVQRRHRRRAHDGAAARARPQHPAGARRRSIDGPLGALEVLRRRADGEDARHPRLRAHRPARRRSARAGFGMRVLAFDPFVSAERYRELGVEKAETLRRASTPQADFITLHLPKTPETEGWLDAEALRQDARTACASSTSPAAR